MKALKCSLMLCMFFMLLPLLCHAQEKQEAQAADKTGVEKPETTISVFFFHTNKECPFSKKIEETSLKAAEEAAPELFKTGVIGWVKINAEQPENAHFVKEFSFDGKAVVLVKTINGEQIAFKNLSKLWDFIKDDQKLLEFFETEIKNFIQAK